MTVHHESDEYLETLYHLYEQHQMDVPSLREHMSAYSSKVLEEMGRHGLIVLNGDQIQLTDEGFRKAEQITRRHRLAERLLTDVLNLSLAEIEKGACEYEHLVADEITDGICTLLGHPRTCPHGHPIPEGPCCKASIKELHRAIVPLTEVPVGKWVRIAYVNSEQDERQHRLTHFNIVPGNMIKVHQRKPAVVVMQENMRLAMEQSIAENIFVWHQPTETTNPDTKETTVPDTKSAISSRLCFWRK